MNILTMREWAGFIPMQSRDKAGIEVIIYNEDAITFKDVDKRFWSSTLYLDHESVIVEYGSVAP